MKYCEKCKVYVPSDREHCPLCQSILTEEDASRSYPGYDDEIFPYLPTIYHRHNLLIRLSLFLSIAVCVICLTLNLLIWPQRWWSLFVLAGVGAGWATVAQAIRKRSSFCQHVLYQVVTVGIVVVLFDLMTGFGHWSFNYVIPALCVFAMVVIAIIAAMGHRSISNYIIYMVVSAVFGLIPLLFLLPRWTTILWPTVLCAAVSVIYLAGLGLFVGRDTWQELHKRLHM